MTDRERLRAEIAARILGGICLPMGTTGGNADWCDGYKQQTKAALCAADALLAALGQPEQKEVLFGDTRVCGHPRFAKDCRQCQPGRGERGQDVSDELLDGLIVFLGELRESEGLSRIYGRLIKIQRARAAAEAGRREGE